MDDLDIDESLPGQELETEDVQEEIRRENDEQLKKFPIGALNSSAVVLTPAVHTSK